MWLSDWESSPGDTAWPSKPSTSAGTGRPASRINTRHKVVITLTHQRPREQPGIQGHAFPIMFPWRKLQSTSRLQGRSRHGTSALSVHSTRKGPGIPSLAWGKPFYKGGLGSTAAPHLGMVHGLMVETKKVSISSQVLHVARWPCPRTLRILTLQLLGRRVLNPSRPVWPPGSARQATASIRERLLWT